MNRPGRKPDLFGSWLKSPQMTPDLTILRDLRMLNMHNEVRYVLSDPPATGIYGKLKTILMQRQCASKPKDDIAATTRGDGGPETDTDPESPPCFHRHRGCRRFGTIVDNEAANIHTSCSSHPAEFWS